MELEMQIDALREEASDIGVFFPMHYKTDALNQPETLHGHAIANRSVLLMQPAFDAAEDGAPSEDTVSRYADAVREKAYGIVVIEPTAVSADAREYEQSLAISDENAASFQALVDAVKAASEEAHGFAPVVIALLTHAGHHALKPAAFDLSASLPHDVPLLKDDELNALLITCADAAKAVEKAGFDGIALNAADRSLFGESLAAFHRDGKFGGDFDDRTRFLRDCYTAMKMVVSDKLFFTVRLCLSDGIPQPDGWGMAFEDHSAPDLYEPALLLKILQTLYGIELVICTIGIPNINWMCEPAPESPLLRYSRLCTCVAMLDSDLQQNVQLVIPELDCEDIPFANLAAGMIEGEFASYGGFSGI